MNYYKRHIGDYARDTGHLSALEHGIYGLLLDWYYVNERPIPDDKANRIAKANRTETESVLTDFFKLTPLGWAHSRADREIAEYQARAETNRVTGRLGGRPKKNPNGYESVSETKPNGTLATNHKPVTIKEQKKEPASPSGSRLPADWVLPADWRLWAEQERPGILIDDEASKFADFWHGKAGKDARKVDWLATWRNWIRNARGVGGRTNTPAPSARMNKLTSIGDMKNGLGNSRDSDRLPKTDLLGLGQRAIGRGDTRNGDGVD